MDLDYNCKLLRGTDKQEIMRSSETYHMNGEKVNTDNFYYCSNNNGEVTNGQISDDSVVSEQKCLKQLTSIPTNFKNSVFTNGRKFARIVSRYKRTSHQAIKKNRRFKLNGSIGMNTSNNSDSSQIRKSNKRTPCMDPHCRKIFWKEKMLISHMKRVHVMCNKPVNLRFSSNAEFENWKNTESLNTFVANGSVTLPNGKYKYYTCKLGSRISIGHQGKSCISKMLTCEKNSIILVNYIPHVNHDIWETKKDTESGRNDQNSCEKVLTNGTLEIDDRYELKLSIRKYLTQIERYIYNGARVASLMDINSKLKEVALKCTNNNSNNSIEEKKGFTDKITDCNGINDVICNVGSYSISLLHLKSLDNDIPSSECELIKSVAPDFRRGWLYDSVIDAFMYKLCKDRSDTMFLETSIIQVILKDSLDSLTTQLGDKNLSDIETIFVPCNPSERHWVLLVVKPKCGEIFCYDPMNSTVPRSIKYIKSIMALLIRDFESIQGWSLESSKHALQKGFYNCGVFVCWYAYRILNKLDVSKRFSANKFRTYIYSCITDKDFSEKYQD